jgi:hypothetical protein
MLKEVLVLLFSLYLPLVCTGPETVYLGDSLTMADPGYIGVGERVVTYHLADSILWLEDSGYHGRVVLELGIHAVHGSDRLYFDNSDLFRYRYWQLLSAAREHSGEVVVLNIPWLDWGPEKYERAGEFNAIIQELAEGMGVCVVDTWKVMESCGLECIGDDGFHPNDLGYELIRGELAECLP